MMPLTKWQGEQMKRTDFCRGWSFRKAGENTWMPVPVPHDAMQLEERSPGAPTGSAGAYYHGGCYEYRKVFSVPEGDPGRYFALLFEGVMPSAKVLLNGRKIGGCAYGYTQFEVPLTGIKAGSTNTVTVIADNRGVPNSRWYTGAGIYRPVWLVEGNAAHIITGGLRVTTLSCEHREIRVTTACTGTGTVSVEILDGEHVIARQEGEDVTFSLPKLELWDADHPNLYTCRAALRDGDTVLDTEETRFGIRQIAWSTQGLFINGRKTLLKGGCIHHDNGILGARCFDEAEWRRIGRLKEYGFNAVRSAHNPLCRSALEACDALGMYVMDETWDMWNRHKTKNDYAAHFNDCRKRDVQAMTDKDYNHPSVILYSVGNEVTEPAQPEGVQLVRDIIAEVKRLDNTRPVTAGINIALLLMAKQGTMFGSAGEPNEKKTDSSMPGSAEVGSTEFNEMAAKIADQMMAATLSPEGDEASSPVLDLLDIAGYNYACARYETEPYVHPDRVIVGSETYPQDLAKTWPVIEKCPWVIGDFMWTAWDYIGEAGIGAWVREEKEQGFAKPYPYKLGGAGALDILGNETAEAGMASVIWGNRQTPYIAVQPVLPDGERWYPAAWRGSNAIPSWSFRGCENRPATVEVYTAAEEAELFLNDVSLGRQAVTDFRAVFTVLYQPGVLRALAYHSDGSRTESFLKSGDDHTRIVIRPEGTCKPGKVLFVDILLCGENGEVECNADEQLRVTVTGGTLLAFGSAAPKTEEAFHTGVYTTHYGRALAAILGEKDEIEIRVQGTDMQSIWNS